MDWHRDRALTFSGNSTCAGKDAASREAAGGLWAGRVCHGGSRRFDRHLGTTHLAGRRSPRRRRVRSGASASLRLPRREAIHQISLTVGPLLANVKQKMRLDGARLRAAGRTTAGIARIHRGWTTGVAHDDAVPDAVEISRPRPRRRFRSPASDPAGSVPAGRPPSSASVRGLRKGGCRFSY